MPNDLIREELIGLLRDSREQARFLGELGVENIALGSPSDQNADAPHALAGAAEAAVRTQPPLEVPRRKTSHASPPPADSLFIEAATTAPSLAKSSETL